VRTTAKHKEGGLISGQARAEGHGRNSGAQVHEGAWGCGAVAASWLCVGAFVDVDAAAWVVCVGCVCVICGCGVCVDVMWGGVVRCDVV